MEQDRMENKRRFIKNSFAFLGMAVVLAAFARIAAKQPELFHFRPLHPFDLLLPDPYVIAQLILAVFIILPGVLLCLFLYLFSSNRASMICMLIGCLAFYGYGHHATFPIYVEYGSLESTLWLWGITSATIGISWYFKYLT